jgi:NADH dehydrogenase
LPPTAQSAERSAEYVAKAIRKRIDGFEIEPFSMSMVGMFVALGGKYAVGEVFNKVKVSGYSAYLLKKAITYIYYLGLRLRMNVGYKNRAKKI